MSCYICGRDTCTPSFQPLEEQDAYEAAGEAHEKFLEVREKCREDWEEREEEEEEE